jgi:hypothetical protein
VDQYEKLVLVDEVVEEAQALVLESNDMFICIK